MDNREGGTGFLFFLLKNSVITVAHKVSSVLKTKAH